MLEGWRSKDKDELAERLVKNAVPFQDVGEVKREAFKAGYRSALLLLKSEVLPRSFIRSPDVAEFQAAIGIACSRIVAEGT